MSSPPIRVAYRTLTCGPRKSLRNGPHPVQMRVRPHHDAASPSRSAANTPVDRVDTPQGEAGEWSDEGRGERSAGAACGRPPLPAQRDRGGERPGGVGPAPGDHDLEPAGERRPRDPSGADAPTEGPRPTSPTVGRPCQVERPTGARGKNRRDEHDCACASIVCTKSTKHVGSQPMMTYDVKRERWCCKVTNAQHGLIKSTVVINVNACVRYQHR